MVSHKLSFWHRARLYFFLALFFSFLSFPNAFSAEYTDTITDIEIEKWRHEEFVYNGVKQALKTSMLIAEYCLVRKKPLSTIASPKYGNWYGPGWWGGSNADDKPGDKPPINSLDMIAMAHDMGYWIAEEQGKLVDNKEKYLLLALADKYCIDEAEELTKNSLYWKFPPINSDRSNAEFYAEAMPDGFVYHELYGRILSAVAYDYPYRKARHLLTPEEFRKQRDERVQEWIFQKEKEISGEVDGLKKEIDEALSKYSKKAMDLRSSMQEKERLARLHASNAMQAAKNAEMRFSTVERQLSQCAADEKMLSEAMNVIDPARIQMEDALRNAKRFTASCQSKADAEKALNQYKEAERYLKHINNNYEKIQSKIRSVEQCRDILSNLSSETKRVLSESDKAIAIIESAANYHNEMDAIKEQREQLESRCGYWTSKIRAYGWSERIIETLGNEIGSLKNFCDVAGRDDAWFPWSNRVVYDLGIDVSKLRIPSRREYDVEHIWDQMKKIEAEARNARAIVRRLSRAIEINEEFGEGVNDNIKRAKDIGNIRQKALFTMSAHSNLPGLITKCESLTATRTDCSRVRDEYFKRCKTQTDAHISKICTPAYPGCRQDVAGCLDAYIIDALLDDFCGKPGYLSCARGQLNSFLACLQDCNSSLIARTINTFGIVSCRTDCQALMEKGTAACKRGVQPPAWPRIKKTIAPRTSAPKAAASGRFGPMEQNTDRRGLDYHSFNLPSPDPMLCQEACAKEQRCRAYTYVKPGHQGPSARCWLKHSVPSPSPDNRCISGVKH